MKRSLTLGVCLLAVALPSPAQLPVFVSQLHRPNFIGRFPPPFTLNSAGRPAISAESLKGRPAMLIFWSTWCRNCFVPVRQLPALLAGSDMQIIGVDEEREPALAPKYLQDHHIDIPNFHDDSRLFFQLHLYAMPHPSVLLLDANGRVVYAQRAIYFEELEAAIASLGPQYARVLQQNRIASTEPPITVPEARELARQATVLQASYLKEQRSFVCKYTITDRDHYGSNGMSTHHEQHTEEVFADTGHRLESHEVTGETPAAPPSDATMSFNAWDDPIFTAVIQHSTLSNLQPSSKETGGIQSTPAQPVLYATFRGDPTYIPANDSERIAQSLEGYFTIDVLRRVVVRLNGIAAYGTSDKSRLLMEGMIPVLDYAAEPFHGAYLPSSWSSLTYQPVSLGPTAHDLWLASLTRTFGQRESCDTLDVKSTVLPGFRPVPTPN